MNLATSELANIAFYEDCLKRLFSRITFSLLMSIMLVGCQSSSPSRGMKTAGFLSDYSHLEPISNRSQRYINPRYNLGDYSKFIIDRVELLVEPGGQSGIESWDELEKLREYLRQSIRFAILPRYKEVTEPGPGVARVRIALTDVKGSIISDVGSVSMEAELLDSQTGEQIAAIIESEKRGSWLQGEYSDKWRNVKAILDAWAQRFYARLEEAQRR